MKKTLTLLFFVLSSYGLLAQIVPRSVKAGLSVSGNIHQIRPVYQSSIFQFETQNYKTGNGFGLGFFLQHYFCERLKGEVQLKGWYNQIAVTQSFNTIAFNEAIKSTTQGVLEVSQVSAQLPIGVHIHILPKYPLYIKAGGFIEYVLHENNQWSFEETTFFDDHFRTYDPPLLETGTTTFDPDPFDWGHFLGFGLEWNRLQLEFLYRRISALDSDKTVFPFVDSRIFYELQFKYNLLPMKS